MSEGKLESWINFASDSIFNAVERKKFSEGSSPLTSSKRFTVTHAASNPKAFKSFLGRDLCLDRLYVFFCIVCLKHNFLYIKMTFFLSTLFHASFSFSHRTRFTFPFLTFANNFRRAKNSATFYWSQHVYVVERKERNFM